MQDSSLLHTGRRYLPIDPVLRHHHPGDRICRRPGSGPQKHTEAGLHHHFAICVSRYVQPNHTRSLTPPSRTFFSHGLPALFLVPYIQLVFSVEISLRGLRRKPFPKRGKYTMAICLFVVCMLVLINFLVADLDRAPDFCFASLFWYIAVYSRGSFAVLLAIDVILVICLTIISVRLTHSTEIEISERVAASRMVYYLALAILSNVSVGLCLASQLRRPPLSAGLTVL